MELHFFNLAIPAFVAGLITFLAPCTLPLVPGYLSFISGVELTQNQTRQYRARVLLSGMLFVAGFTGVFVLFGLSAGLLGQSIGPWQTWLTRLGGVVVVLFGLFMLGVFNNNYLQKSIHVRVPKVFKSGKPLNAFIFGLAFGLGWTPCIGPILASILLLASTQATVVSGGVLLLIFSLGLAAPFLILALAVGHATAIVARLNGISKLISVIGGIFLIILGVLMVTNQFGAWVAIFYAVFSFANYQKLL